MSLVGAHEVTVVCVCVCVCVWVCVCVCVYACMCMCVYCVSVHTGVCVCTIVCVRVCVTNLYYDYDLRMSLYLVLVLWSPVSDVIYGLGVRASMV